MGLYTSPMGAFLSERTMRSQTRKVPILLYVDSGKNDHTIIGSMVKWYCPLKRETYEI